MAVAATRDAPSSSCELRLLRRIPRREKLSDDRVPFPDRLVIRRSRPLPGLGEVVSLLNYGPQIFVVLRALLRGDDTQHVAAGRDERQFVTLLTRPASTTTFWRSAAGQSLPWRILAFEPRAYLLGLVDLRRTVYRVTDAVPDGREATFERGFHPTNTVVDGVVGVIEKRRDPVDTEEGISLENKCNEELAGGEFRIVERCFERVGYGMTAVSAPDTGEISEVWMVCSPQLGHGACCQASFSRRSMSASSGSECISKTPSETSW